MRTDQDKTQKTLSGDQIAQTEADLTQAAAPKVAPAADLPRSLQPIDSDTAAELFFTPAESQQSQRAVVDRTAYGALVLHRY